MRILLYSILLSASFNKVLAIEYPTGKILEKIDKLEQNIDRLNSKFYSNPNVNNYDYSPNLEVRLSELEEKIRELTGRIEKIEFSLNILNKNFEGMSDNITKVTDYKLRQSQNLGNVDLAKPPSKYVKPKEEVARLELENKIRKEFDLAYNLLQRSRYKEAKDKFNEFIKNNANHYLVGEAYYWKAEALMIEEEYEKAGVNFLRSYKGYPKGSKAAESLLGLAISLTNLEKNDDACSILVRLNKEFDNLSDALLHKIQESSSKIGCRK